jgi:hypothetical protein
LAFDHWGVGQGRRPFRYSISWRLAFPSQVASEPRGHSVAAERPENRCFGYLQPALLTSATALPTHWLGDRVGADASPCGV